MLFIIVSHAKDDLKKSIYDQTSVIIKKKDMRIHGHLRENALIFKQILSTSSLRK